MKLLESKDTELDQIVSSEFNEMPTKEDAHIQKMSKKKRSKIKGTLSESCCSSDKVVSANTDEDLDAIGSKKITKQEKLDKIRQKMKILVRH